MANRMQIYAGPERLECGHIPTRGSPQSGLAGLSTAGIAVAKQVRLSSI
jgi:hypothetical protein